MRDDRNLNSEEIYDRLEELTVDAEPADDDRGYGLHGPLAEGDQ